MNQFTKDTINYVVDATATSLGEGREEQIEYPCGCSEAETNTADEQKIGNHSEME